MGKFLLRFEILEKYKELLKDLTFLKIVDTLGNFSRNNPSTL